MASWAHAVAFTCIDLVCISIELLNDLTLSKVCVYCLLQVLIRVIDTNNHRPQFSEEFYEVNVAEDEPPGTEVLQISASDRDEKNKLTFTLLSSTDPFSLRKFRLDPGTGTLYTAEKLDHETMHRHILTVMVRTNAS